jgi:chromosome segregation ATPase
MGVDSTHGSTPPPRDAPARGSLIYAVGVALALLGVLAVALYGISRERGGPAPAPTHAASALPARDASAELNARLGSFGEQLDALAEHAAALRKRVDTLERELAGRPASAPSTVPAAARSSAPADLEPLYARLSAVETSLQREGADRLKSQENLLARVYTLEASRGDRESARLAQQQAAEERVYKLEQRLHSVETQLLDAERRLAARLEKLEAR